MGLDKQCIRGGCVSGMDDHDDDAGGQRKRATEIEGACWVSEFCEL